MELLNKDFPPRARAVLAAVAIALMALICVGSSGAAEPKTGRYVSILSSAESMPPGLWRWKKAFTQKEA